jgi:pimeloyl-ACP methyl ester carboxylesterase
VELADALELPRFGIVGFSAGTPWAAACGALILERVTRIGIAHSRALAAYDFLERPEALEQLSDEDSHDYGLVRDLGPEAAADALIVQEEGWARDVAEHPARVMDGYPMPEGDRWLCDDPPLARFLLDGFRDAVRQGAVGMVWQFIAYVQAWGFRLADVSVPVDLWHGAQDPRVTMESQEFLVRTIPDARLTVWPDVGHFGIAKHWPEVLEAVTRPV